MKFTLILITLLLLLTTLGCHHTNVNLLPKELVGFWTTDEPMYADRFVELYRAYVIIGTGSKEVPKVQAVDSVEAKQEGDSTVYTISSSDLSGATYKMILLYKAGGGGELRFRHMENLVWKRHVENNNQSQPTLPQKAPVTSTHTKNAKSEK